MSRADWIKCIQRDKDLAWCGRDIWMEWRFLDLSHAERTIERGERLVPCKKCLREARKDSR